MHFINQDTSSHKMYKIITTFIIVNFTWIFFRANNIKHAFQMIKSIFSIYNPWILFDNNLYHLGLDRKDFLIMIIAIIILFIADFIKWKGYSIRQWIYKQEIWFRWLFYLTSIFIVLVFGIWGPEFKESAFIYFQF